MSLSVDLPRAEGMTQRILTTVLRSSIQGVFRYGMSPRHSPQWQRWLLRQAVRTTVVSRKVRITQGHLGGVPCEWLDGLQDNGWVLLYLHGGAFIVGGPQTHRAITSRLAELGGLRVCALDYRLAPEHPYPAASDDALVAYQALLVQGQAAQRIAIVGDSAGGNLVLNCAQRLRELSLPAPAALVCLSPVTDLTGSVWHEPAAGDPMITQAWLAQGVDAYCPPDVDRNAPLLSPLQGDLSGLPPLLVQVGEDEHLLSHSLRLQEHAELDLRLEVYPRQWHVFQANWWLLDIADLALTRIIDFLRQRGCA